MEKGTDRLKVALSWALVSLPLAWGVLATIRKAMSLFQ